MDRSQTYHEVLFLVRPEPFPLSQKLVNFELLGVERGGGGPAPLVHTWNQLWLIITHSGASLFFNLNAQYRAYEPKRV